jgi:predicted nucleotidyltransferase
MTSALPIFRSPSQARLLTYLYVIAGDERESLSELARKTRIPLSTLAREVDQLERAGLVISERLGNMRLVSTNPESPFFRDLKGLVMKAFGPTAVLASLLERIPDVEHAYIYGSWARRYQGEETAAPRDIDVLVVGEPEPNAVYAAARRAESELAIDVNPLLATPGEWEAATGVLKRIRSGPLVELDLSDASP